MVSYQRFATLNDIALSNQVVQNLGLWEISSRGTLWTQSTICLGRGQWGGVAQLPVTKELRLGCPAYVCGGGPGDHTSSGWSSSSTELYRNHMPSTWLVKWLQPSGSPRRQTRNRDLQKGSATCLQEETLMLQTYRSHVTFPEAVSISEGQALED